MFACCRLLINGINRNRKLCFSCDDGTAIGQNLHMSKVYEGYPTVNVSNVVKNGWWSEKKFYTYSSMGCQTGQMCGHYTQVR